MNYDIETGIQRIRRLSEDTENWDFWTSVIFTEKAGFSGRVCDILQGKRFEELTPDEIRVVNNATSAASNVMERAVMANPEAISIVEKVLFGDQDKGDEKKES